MKKLLKKLDRKTDWTIPFYFQFIHALGLFAGAFLLSLGMLDLFQNLRPYAKFILLIIWAILILITNIFAVKSWKKGFFISTGIFLIIYIFYLINTS